MELPPIPPLTRRRFLALGAGGAAALLLPGCSVPFFGGQDNNNTAGGVPFGLWKQMLDAVRQSPDHLPAAADRAVAAKDAAALLALVRDKIWTALPVGDSFADPVTWTRWGPAAALRGGSGTPREKAELLALLLRRAGFKATVVSGQLRDPEGALRAILAHRPDRSFQPAVDSATVDRWRSAMGVHDQKKAPVIDANGAASKQLAATILAALPAGITAGRGTVAPLSRLPLVRVEINGKSQFANPNLPGAKLGDSGTATPPDDAPTADTIQRIHATLIVSTTAAPQKQITLVEKEWGADELVGRQVRIEFRPAQDLAVALQAPVRDLHVFIPALSVTGPGLSNDAAAKLSASGPAVTTGGQIVNVDASGTPTVDGVPLPMPGSGGQDNGAAAAVASVTVDVIAQAFPRLTLRVGVADKSGVPIPGLPASAFRVSDQGHGIGFLMAENRLQGPKILLVLDESGSIPAEFTSPQGRDALARGIADRILASHPDATFQVMAVDGGTIPTTDGFTLRDSAAVSAAVAKADSFGSGIWAALRDANLARPTVIVLVTDGQADEKMIDGFRATVRAGAPVIAAAVGTPDNNTMDDIAALSGGVRVNASAPADVVTAASRFLDRRQTQPYRLDVTVPATGPSHRTLTVTVPARGVSGSAGYDVPAATTRTPAPALASIRLALSVGGSLPQTRVIAGYAGDSPPPTGTALPQSLLDDVHGALIGGTLLSVEGGAPPLAVWLDDLISARLGLQKLHDAAAGTDRQAVIDAIAAGVPVLPAVLPTLHTPLPDTGEGSTHEDSLRLVLYSERPRIGGPRHKAVDVLPSTRWITAAEDPATAFTTTLTRTARLALAEAAALPTSTASLLRGASLRNVPPGYIGTEAVAFIPEDKRKAWVDLLNTYSQHHRVIPVTGDPIAFWAVDPATGSLLGVLGDGSGGSFADDVECQINDLQSLMSLLAFIGGLGGLGGLNVWAIFAKIEAAQVLRAAKAIELMDVPGGDNKFFEDAKDAACDLIKEGVFQSFPILEGLAVVDGFLDVLHRSMPCGFNNSAESKNLC